MAKHSERDHNPTRVTYQLNSSQLRLSRFTLRVESNVESSVESNVAPSEDIKSYGHMTAVPCPAERYTIYSFDDAPARIGKLGHTHVSLTDETVSRLHCEITREGDAYLLTDLDSTNGTFINDIRVKQAYLEPGLTFRVGSARITFDLAQDELSIQPSSETSLGRIIGADLKMREIFSLITKLAPTDTTVVIEGETGTGKEVVAQTIHEVSSRAQGPFVVVDCSAIPSHLIESELFGHEKGSFTGAIMARKGLFEQASGGTIFLDELGELSLDLQPKLLRVLESRKIRRVGGTNTTSVDVRVIAATNRHLENEVSMGRFREDLFYRLSVVRIFLPPLRERMIDIPLLLKHFLSHARFNQEDGRGPKVTRVSGEALYALQTHQWPGNIRELLNVVERACAFTESHMISLDDLPQPLQKCKSQQSATRTSSERGFSLSELDLIVNHTQHQDHLRGESKLLEKTDISVSVIGSGLSGEASSDNLIISSPDASASHHAEQTDDEFESFKIAKERWLTLFERDYILAALKRSKYNISHAAREAEVDRKHFRKLMNKYGIEIP